VVNCADEVLHNLSSDLVIDNAQPCSPAEELFEAERFVVIDDFVVGESHEEVCEADAAVGAFGGEENFLVEDFESAAALSYFVNGEVAEEGVELVNVDV